MYRKRGKKIWSNASQRNQYSALCGLNVFVEKKIMVSAIHPSDLCTRADLGKSLGFRFEGLVRLNGTLAHVGRYRDCGTVHGRRVRTGRPRRRNETACSGMLVWQLGETWPCSRCSPPLLARGPRARVIVLSFCLSVLCVRDKGVCLCLCVRTIDEPWWRAEKQQSS